MSEYQLMKHIDECGESEVLIEDLILDTSDHDNNY